MFKEVFKVVKKIPKGKVATYGQIAEMIGTKDARKIGWALNSNNSSEVPCHRVVTKEGKISKSFAFDGAEEQRRRLEKEGVIFLDEMHVDLKKHLWEE